MVFIRLKNRVSNGKNLDYAYLVENSYRRNGPKQKVKKYLGRIYKFDIVKDVDIEVVDGSYKKLLSSLFDNELRKHGFVLKDNVYVCGECSVDLNNLKFWGIKGNKIVIQINAGFICEYSLNELFNLNFNEGEEFKKGFAKKLVLSGLDIKPEVFVELYKRLVVK